MTLLALALVVLLAQDAPPKPPPPPDARPAGSTGASPASTLVPGALPADADTDARMLWHSLCQHSLAPGASRTPVTAFDLSLDVTVRSSQNQSNEAQKLRYRYQAPGFLRTTTANAREHLRGPEGDFMIDPSKKEKAPLVGRDFAEDRRQLDEEFDLARNFVALADPAALRLASLKKTAVDLATLPEDPQLRAAARELTWIEILTPDFRLPRPATERAPDAAPLVRVQLGLRRDTNLPELAIVGRDARAGGPARSNLIHVRTYAALEGLMAPWNLAVYELDDAGKAFRPSAALEVYLRKDSTLRPKFAPETFLK